MIRNDITLPDDCKPLDKPVFVTRFPNQSALKKKTRMLSMRDLADEIQNSHAPDKSSLKWYKLARFDTYPTEKGCLRNNDNVILVSGIEADYDAGNITPKQAAARLRKHKIAGLIYSTASSTPESPRWRIFAPFSTECEPEDRTEHMERLYGVFDGTLDGASFTLSQAYYGGNVEGNDPIEVILTDGDFIDKLTHLPRLPKGKNTNGENVRDDSGSGELFRLAMSIKSKGGTFDKFLVAINDNRAASNHVQRNGQRSIDRAWKNAAFENLADEFEDLPPLEGKDQRYKIDEDGVISAFTAKYKDSLRFDHMSARWFKFDGNAWRREETKLAHHYARELSTNMAKHDPKAKALRKVSIWEAIERGARSVREFATLPEHWDSNPYLLGTPNGTVNLKTGELYAGKPSDMISKLSAVAPIRLQDFKAERDCPQWLRFLSEALDGDAEAIRFMQQWGGYSLTGDTKEQSLLFVYGRGGSGKSTALNTISDIMGEYAINVATSTLTATKHDAHPEELARLDGARLAHASETEKGKAWAENRIKSLTGGDRITARFMRQNSFDFTPQFKLAIVGNNQPTITNVDEAIQRRFIILPFDHAPRRKDSGLALKLQREWSGILSWLIQGCLDWQANGLVRPHVSNVATDEYFATHDIFQHWIDECCVIGDCEIDTTSNLWESWNSFAWSRGEPAGSRERTFPETLKQHGFKGVRDRGGIRGRGYHGIRVDAGCMFDD